ncbi:MAG: magnesium/cobalt transporter CorA [Gammaproteobacteria bacterium]
MKRLIIPQRARAIARYSRSRFFPGLYRKPGTPPGTLERAPIADEPLRPPARLSLIRYDATEFDERPDVAVEDCVSPGDVAGITWLHVQGAPTPELLERLGQIYGLHPLALEDVLNQGQRTKFEVYEDQYFVVLNSPRHENNNELAVEQVNYFLGKGYVITLDESPNDRFEPIRQRLRNKRTVRERGADYLFYSLLDLIVDEGFPVLDALGERLEQVETDVLDNPTQELRNQIHYIKRELILLRRAWWPQREVINNLIRNDDEEFLSETTRLYMRDCYDHSIRMIDFVETYREMASSLLDTYLSSVSQRMNDVMKALTIIATIFLPLTFVAGVYGMNFSHQASPWTLHELTRRYRYFYALGVMALIVIIMVIYFKRKRWL